MSEVVHRNIRSIVTIRQQEESRRTTSNRIAHAITAFAGSMSCVFAHVVVYGSWILLNTGNLPRPRPFDPYPFPMLGTVACIEAIFLALFILITQNRMQRLADHRAELDLQISLLAEHELTGVARVLDEIARRLNLPPAALQSIQEAKQDIDATRVSEAILRAESAAQDEVPPDPDSKTL